MSAMLAEADSHSAWLEPLFDVAFAAPGGMALLRQLILTLAMQGKLVPQLASEAPASTLLKQIAAEKGTSVGKLGQVKESSPISDSEKPYTIPGCWEWVRLGEVTDIIRGITFPASEKTKEPAKGRIACLRTANVQKEIEWGDLLYIDRKFMSKSSQLIRRDDIVMSMANSRELVGKVAIVKDMPVEEATFGGFLGVLRTHRVMPLFVLHLLNTKYARGTLVDAASQTTNIANISLGKLNPFLVPLPPLEEQKRIVARIDELMSRCDELESLRSVQESKRRGARAAAVCQWLAGDDAAAVLLGKHFATLVSTRDDVAELRKAILQKAVMGKLVPQDPAEAPASELLKQIAAEKTVLVKAEKIRMPKPLESIADAEKPYAIPESWEWVRLGEIGLIGSSSRVHQKDWKKSGVPFYRAREIVKLSANGFVENELFISESLYRDLSRDGNVPEQGDVMITGVGTIGVPYVVREIDRFYFKDASVLIFKNHYRILPSYIFQFFKSPYWMDTIHAESMGTTVHTLTIGRANKVLFPLPPLDEQIRIVSRIDELMKLCDTLDRNIDAVQAKQAELLDAVMARV